MALALWIYNTLIKLTGMRLEVSKVGYSSVAVIEQLVESGSADYHGNDTRVVSGMRPVVVGCLKGGKEMVSIMALCCV